MKRVFAEYDEGIMDESFWSWYCPHCGQYEEENEIGQKAKEVSCRHCHKTYLITFFRDDHRHHLGFAAS